MISRLVNFNDATFSEWTGGKAAVTVVCVGATWCESTKAIAPVLNDLAAKYAGRARFAMVDYDESPELVKKHKVTIVPTVLVNGLDCEEEISGGCIVSLDERRTRIDAAIERAVQPAGHPGLATATS